jgi:hypothetical protein
MVPSNFDYPKFAEPFRNRIRENAEKLEAWTASIAVWRKFAWIG